jgi:hypothetical protein
MPETPEMPEMPPTNELCNLCDRVADIVGGEAMCENGLCVVSRLRPGLTDVTILDEATNSPLVLPLLLSFEDLDDQGRALSLGETVLTQDEVNRFISALRCRGIIVTALHNHWLFEEPRLMYLHWEAIMRPVSFANAVAAAFEDIGFEL